MIERTVEEMYRDDEANQFLEVTYQNGDKEIMYFKDFSSGAMIENIVRRAKKLAIKRAHRRRRAGASAPRTSSTSIHQEYKEHEDLPNTTNPDDWAKISGKKGERIVYVRTLISQHDDEDADRRPLHRAGRHRPVPLDADGRDRRHGPIAGRVARGDPQDLRHRDRVRDRRPRRAASRTPIAASSLLINAYVTELERAAAGRRPRSAGTSRTSRPATTPGAFAPRRRACAPEVETHLVNAVLTNGARYYVDHAHPELSTPECADARGGRRVRPGRPSRSSPRSMDGRRPAPARRARRSSSTRTTPTARATATAATRTT